MHDSDLITMKHVFKKNKFLKFSNMLAYHLIPIKNQNQWV